MFLIILFNLDFLDDSFVVFIADQINNYIKIKNLNLNTHVPWSPIAAAKQEHPEHSKHPEHSQQIHQPDLREEPGSGPPVRCSVPALSGI